MPQPSELTLLRKIEEVAEHVGARSPDQWLFWIKVFVNHIADTKPRIYPQVVERTELWSELLDYIEKEEVPVTWPPKSS